MAHYDDAAIERRLVDVVDGVMQLADTVVEIPDYSHPKSPRRYTQKQQLACLVLRKELACGYRRTVWRIQGSKRLQRHLGFRDEVPCPSALKCFAERFEFRQLRYVRKPGINLRKRFGSCATVDEFVEKLLAAARAIIARNPTKLS